MNAVHNFPLLAALCCVSVTFAQAQQPPSPVPPTTQTQDTAKDRTSPNPSATKPINPGDPQTPADPTPDPRQSTSPTEGTAADRTAPGRTPTTAGATAQRSELVGAAVVAPNGTTIGKVVDVVFDAVSQPAFVVIASENGPAAVPYSVASSMQSEGKVVMDRAKLTSAPKVKDGEWRSKSGSQWQQDATRYWKKGG
jgi:sporulation protein YlmC with PRC-barrel domain